MIKSEKVNVAGEAKKFMGEIQDLNKNFINGGFKKVLEGNDDLNSASLKKNKKIKKRI